MLVIYLAIGGAMALLLVVFADNIGVPPLAILFVLGILYLLAGGTLLSQLETR